MYPKSWENRSHLSVMNSYSSYNNAVISILDPFSFTIKMSWFCYSCNYTNATSVPFLLLTLLHLCYFILIWNKFFFSSSISCLFIHFIPTLLSELIFKWLLCSAISLLPITNSFNYWINSVIFKFLFYLFYDWEGKLVSGLHINGTEIELILSLSNLDILINSYVHVLASYKNKNKFQN